MIDSYDSDSTKPVEHFNILSNEKVLLRPSPIIQSFLSTGPCINLNRRKPRVVLNGSSQPPKFSSTLLLVCVRTVSVTRVPVLSQDRLVSTISFPLPFVLTPVPAVGRPSSGHRFVITIKSKERDSGPECDPNKDQQSPTYKDFLSTSPCPIPIRKTRTTGISGRKYSLMSKVTRRNN